MKKVLTLLFFGLSVYVQAAAGSGLPVIKLGVKGGYVLQSYDTGGAANGSYAADMDGSHSGFQAGFVTRIEPSSLPLHLQCEVLYEHFTIKGSSTYRFNTVNFPILAGVNFGLGGAGLRLATGPSLTLMSHTTRNGEEDLTANDILRRPFMWNFGAGADIGKLSLDIRYGFSFGERTVGSGRGHKFGVKGCNFLSLSAAVLF